MSFYQNNLAADIKAGMSGSWEAGKVRRGEGEKVRR